MFSFFKCLLRPVSYDTSRKFRFQTWLEFAEVFWLFALILLLPAVGCATGEIPKADNVVPVVVIALPEMNPVREVRRYTGRLQAAERVEIRARRWFLRAIFVPGRGRGCSWYATLFD